jgi:hypothetical protein
VVAAILFGESLSNVFKEMCAPCRKCIAHSWCGFSLASKEKEILKDLNLKENYFGY